MQTNYSPTQRLRIVDTSTHARCPVCDRVIVDTGGYFERTYCTRKCNALAWTRTHRGLPIANAAQIDRRTKPGAKNSKAVR
jgi:hypothetical protein